MKLQIKKEFVLTIAAIFAISACILNILSPLREAIELMFIALVWTIFIFTANSIRDLKSAQEQEHCARMQAEKRTKELEALRLNISDMLSEHDLSKLLDAILSKAALLLDAAAGELALVNRQNRKIEIKALLNIAPERLGSATAFGDGILGKVAQNRIPVTVHRRDFEASPIYAYPFHQWNSIIAIPLEAAGKLYGVLSLAEKNRDHKFCKADIELLTMFAQHAAMSVRTVLLLEKAQHQAQTDSLTGLYNHRRFFEMAEAEIQRSTKQQQSLCAMMFDIDFFKQVNDTFGHSTGDQVLTSIAALCRQIFRESDIVGRYGGEEFAVLLPETDIETAKEAAERIRRGVEEMRFATDKGAFSISISAGIASLSASNPTLGELLHRADEALYEAKHNGRNKICVWKAQSLELRT
ncbi:MAG: sensor domain-containing diguanylate cyclase [Chitinispirillia bacterium]|nr:sensor domain-containing diguanylate cyclase [Chitinispirillia bacterium]